MTETDQQPRGKGRPTPKRSEAEKGRRTPLVTPRGGAAGKKLGKEERLELRRQMRESMRTGDEKHLPPMHAGPERALVRDVVDSRLSFAWLVLPGWFAGFLASLMQVAVAQAIGSIVLSLVFGILIADSIGAVRTVRRALTERFPDASRKGLTYYGIARNMQPRRWRRPPPRVSRGEQV